MARDRKLSADERILWGKVARSTRPMPGKAGALTELDAFLAEAEAAAEREQEKQTPATLMPPQPTAPSTAKPSAGVHHPLEKPVKRKIAKGRLALEARIDLHGMVQSQAHAILLDFLIRAHERGMRHVLVITGKGSSMGSEGALKRAVPLWFSKPEFRYLISSYEPAAQHHGGEGALYIRLSRRHGERP
ncbi:Smr/MutS family protein [Rhizobium leguminosarum]|uniref:Smr/MutS family protein n=1 Tax=Rhizobium TaxID=379 RepID=UPI00103A4149|nr:Smr/MutS family protein [Rhizobium leguminosarum]MBY5904451.1 Smr/MutS family protein [Rhizobium leguminosarum]MBY5911290.1 Smr/MutS family protein [Rhizobium leguminosarum]NKJ99605.1 DNA mismatch repair protein MutS [Rhizobium leguminosarum bv. viciae]TBZ79557.1 DNA mismatch repair protein MutS [Rhizobium leguminosarum bv. viciae]TCA17903.1 DNA mismatch repair protein MutS [Rhizobium leguminosarum bv. viciae]